MKLFNKNSNKRSFKSSGKVGSKKLFYTAGLIFVIFSLIAFLYVYYLIVSFNIDFSDRYESSSVSDNVATWMFVKCSDERLEVALIDEILIMFVSDDTEKIYTLNLNKDLLLEDRTVYNRNGVIRVSDVLIRSLVVAEFDNPLDSLKWYMEELISHPINQLVIIPNKVYQATDLTLLNCKDTLFNWSWKRVLFEPNELTTLFSNIYSTSTVSQFEDLQIKVYKYLIVGKEIIPDQESSSIEEGIVYKFVSFDKWNSVLRSFDIYESLVFEQGQIEIYNATSQIGLGSRLARWLRNSSLLVVRTENAPLLEVESCNSNTVYVTDKNSFVDTVDKITEIMDDRFGGTGEILYKRPDFVSTGDIVIILCEKDN